MRHTLKLLALLALVVCSRPAVAAPETGTAAVTLTVPVGATLTINGQHTHQMTGTRYFVTPDLPVGGAYRYVFVATFTWYGEEVTRKKQLDVTPGQTYAVDMLVADVVPKPVENPVPVVKPEPPKPVVPKVETPKPAPKVEPKPKVETPRPAPNVEVPVPPVQPKPQPKPADPVKPKEPVAQPDRQVAPKPREVKAKK